MASVEQGATALSGVTTDLITPAGNVTTPTSSGASFGQLTSFSTITNADGSDIGTTAESVFRVPPDRETTPPVITYVGSTTITSTASVQVTVVDNSGLLAMYTVQATLPSGAVEVVYNGTTFEAPYAASGVRSAIAGGFSFTFTRAPSWPGNVTIRAAAADQNGNSAAASQAYTITGADTSGPVVGSFSPAAGASIATSGTLQFDVTDAGSGVSIIEVLAVHADGSTEPVYSAAGAFVAPFSASSTKSAITNGFRFVITRTGGWAIGIAALAIRAVDALGNVTIGLYEVNVPDVVAPTFAGATSTSGPTTTTTAVNWSAASDNVTAPSSITYDVCYATSAGACTGGSWSALASSVPGATSITIGGLTPGTLYYFCVRARDAAGNRDTNNVTVTATTTALDSTAPTVTFVGSATITRASEVVVQVTDAGAGLAAAMIFVTHETQPQGGREYTTAYGAGAFLGPFSATSTTVGITNGTEFHVTRGGWPTVGGTVQVAVMAVDAAGNTFVSSRTYTISDADEIGPVLANVAPAAASLIASTDALTFDIVDHASTSVAAFSVRASLGTGAEELVVSRALGGSTVVASGYTGATVSSSVSHGFHLSLVRDAGWPPGALGLVVEARDGLSNVATHALSYARAAVTDAVAPVISNVTPAPGTPIQPTTALVVDVTDDSGGPTGIVLEAQFVGFWEVVYDEAFSPVYLAGSSITPIAGGFRFRCVRTGGWPQPPTLRIRARDVAGNEV